MSRSRLDHELVRRGLLPTRSRARLAVIDGRVNVDGSAATRPSQQVTAAATITVDPEATRYVSRGGHKLASALAVFPILVEGRTAADVGASTGGFTDVLLQQGAASVMALDVGHGQMHENLSSDPRVRVVERVSIRDADPVDLGAPFGIVVVDLSFISLDKVAAAVADLGDDHTDWVVLVKPQFEVGPEQVAKGGVVRAAGARRRALEKAAAALSGVGLVVCGATPSPITGGSGNQEALLWLRRNGDAMDDADLYKVLDDE